VFLLAERFPGDPEMARRLHQLRASDESSPPLPMHPAPTVALVSQDAKARAALLAIVDRHLAESPVKAPDVTSPSSIHAQT
jgi:multidrug resistance protein MdtO